MSLENLADVWRILDDLHQQSRAISVAHYHQYEASPRPDPHLTGT